MTEKVFYYKMPKGVRWAKGLNTHSYFPILAYIAFWSK